MIFVSTGGVRDVSADEVARELLAHDIVAIELSGGRPKASLHKDLLELSRQCTFQVHNYFPPPSDPFVFNLASLDQAIATRSFDHVLTAMRWAVDLKRPIFSFHAGFLLDPRPAELGKHIAARPLYDRTEAMKCFLDRVNLLARHAETEGVSLLIENNVISASNLCAFSANPLLMCTPDEVAMVMKSTPDNVNLLLDVAHWKVSATSLGCNVDDMFRLCDPWIRGYHLSDNDGLRDSNEEVREDSWFWPYLKNDLGYYTLEIYNVSTEVLVEQQRLTRRKLWA